MIHVDRLAVGAPPSLLERAPEAMEELGRFFTQQQKERAQRRAPFHSLWSARDVREALTLLFGRRCAFCESPLAASGRVVVAHFRPREHAAQLDGRVDRDHYWWLAYEWNNLYASCADCSETKGMRFPTAGSRAPIRATGTELVTEGPLLLDPCLDQPESLLKFLESGAVEGLDERGKVTIDVFGLNRTSLVADRRDHVGMINRVCAEYIDSGDPGRVDQDHFIQTVLDKVGSSSPFIALTRQQVRLEYTIMTSYTLTRPIRVLNPVRLERHPSAPGRTGAAPIKAELRQVVKPVVHRGAVWLDRIEIENFKALRQLELRFPVRPPDDPDGLPSPPSGDDGHEQREPWLMLIGENGVGKSSVLRAIALALMPEAQRRAQVKRPGDLITRGGARSGIIRLHFTIGSAPLELHFSRKSSRFLVKGELPEIAVLGYGATRLLPAAERTRPRPERIRVANLFNPQVALRDAERWIANPKAVTSSDFNLLCTSLKTILPLDEEGYLSRRSGALFTRVFDNTMPIRDLSDGYQSMLALVVDMMLNLSHATFDMRGVEGIVLLDELEVHLHPRWKIAIVSELRRMFPRVRIIATTHDPLCVQGLRPGELHVMARDPKSKAVRVEQVDVPPGLRADQVLTGAWFGLPSTRDPKTLELMNEHSKLLVMVNKTPDAEARQAELGQVLQSRLREYAGTATEQLGLSAAAEVAGEEPPAETSDGRERLRVKILERLKQKTGAAGGGGRAPV